MDAQTFATTAFLTLFVIIDPVGLTSLFLGVTDHLDESRRRAVGFRAVLIAGGILITFMFGGGPLLDYLGVSVAALQIAGGLLLFKLSFDMVLARRERQTDDEEEEAHHRDDIAVFPLAIPLIAGPGAFATILVLATISRGRVEYVSILIGAVIAVLLLVYVGFRLAIPIQKVLRGTGTAVVTRVLGIILAALSVQLVIDGVITVIEGM